MNFPQYLSIRILTSFTILLLMSALYPSIPKANAAACVPITSSPLIYQINRSNTQATLYFTPINDQIVSYTIIYGLNPGDERYSITFNSGISTGAISYTVNNLQPGVQYFYKVRSNTSCTYSHWSNWIGDKEVIASSVKGTSTSVIPVTGSDIFMPYLLLSLGIISLGLFFVRFSINKSYF